MRIRVFSLLTFFCAVALIGISGSEAFGQTNLALNKTAYQSSVNIWKDGDIIHGKGSPENAVDGSTVGDALKKIAETDYQQQNDSWFEVDLGNFYKIDKIVIYPRTDCCQSMFKSAYIIVTDQAIGKQPMVDDAKIASSSTYSKFYDPIYETGNKARTISTDGSVGRYVRVQIKGGGAVQLAEIEVFGSPTPVAGHTPDAGKSWTSTAVASGSTSNASSASNAGNTSNPSTGGDSSIDPKNLTRNAVVKATAKQSSTNTWDHRLAGPATKAIDGKKEGGFDKEEIVETKDGNNDWFEVDLGNFYKIDKIVIYPRTDCCQSAFNATWVIVTDQPLEAQPMVDDARIMYSSTFAKFNNPLFTADGDKEPKTVNTNGSVGRYVRLQMKGQGKIELAEIEVFGEPTAVANHKPIPAKAWNAVLQMPFDPNYPNFRGATEGYFDTLQGSPKIIGVKNSATGSFDIAFQDHYGDSKLIKVNTYEKSGAGFNKNAAKSMELTGLGVFAGFAKDAVGNRFIFTSERWKNWEDLVTAKVYKNSEELWTAKYFAAADTNPQMVTGVKALMNSFKTGTSRLVAGKNSLLITTNIFPSHPYQVILDTQNKSNNDSRGFFQSLNQHNFGQRAFFDGSDFVVMENRDHDVTVSLTKLSPDKPLPLIDETKSAEEIAKMTERQKWEQHPGPLTKRLYSVYSHTNFANHTFTELGNVEKGLNDNGYLVLFASERDWDNKMSGYTSTDKVIKTWSQPQIFSPRDIGLVHVKKDFEKETANWVDKDGKLTQCPVMVDNSKLVNSTEAAKTVKYQTANDGWDWTRYAPGSGCENIGERSLITKGVKWVTNLGAPYELSKTKATGEFTSVNHPKLVRIATNKYVVLWEEWKAESAGDGQPKKEYVTTKAASVTLIDRAGQVEIQSSAIKDLGKIRLMPGDDAFEFEGKAAWAVGDSTKNKLMFYTVDGSLNTASFELEL